MHMYLSIDIKLFKTKFCDLRSIDELMGYKGQILVIMQKVK